MIAADGTYESKQSVQSRIYFVLVEARFFCYAEATINSRGGGGAIETMKRKILGIDPGIAILGFGTIVCQTADELSLSAGCQGKTSFERSPVLATPTLLDFGTIETPAKTPFGDRLCTIYEDLQTLISETRPDLVAVEKLFFYRMSHTITVAQARGVLMLVLAQANLPYIEFTPPQIKQALTGHGNAPKIEVQEAVARELALDYIPRPDDAADALAIALTAWFHQ